MPVQEPWGGAGILGDRGAASAAGEQEGSTAAQGHAAGLRGAHLSLSIPRDSVYIIPHSPGQAAIPAHAARTAALQTHLWASDAITGANNKEVQMRMIILLVLHAEGQRARISHSPVWATAGWLAGKRSLQRAQFPLFWAEHVVLWFCLISSTSPLRARQRVGENNQLLSGDKQRFISPGRKWRSQDATAVFSHTISALDCSHYTHCLTTAWKELPIFINTQR